MKESQTPINLVPIVGKGFVFTTMVENPRIDTSLPSLRGKEHKENGKNGNQSIATNFLGKRKRGGCRRKS